MKISVDVPEDLYNEMKKLIEEGVFRSEEDLVIAAITSVVESYKLVREGSITDLLKVLGKGNIPLSPGEDVKDKDTRSIIKKFMDSIRKKK